MTRTETKGERKRTTTTNRIPVLPETWWKKLLHKFFPWALNRLLFLRMRIFKKWFNRFFFSFLQE